MQYVIREIQSGRISSYNKIKILTTLPSRPLRPTNPASGETVLALGSSRVVVFEGGPLPWIGKPTSHFAQGMSLNN